MRHKFERTTKKLAVACFMFYSRYGSAHCRLTISSRSAHGQLTVSAWSTQVRSRLPHVQENSSPV